MSGDDTFADDIVQQADGKPILAIIIGEHGCSWRRDESIPAEKFNLPLSWAEALPFLSYAYDRGFGGADCHAITAWTEDRVIFVHEYDGATHLAWMPRHIVAHTPRMGGLT